MLAFYLLVAIATALIVSGIVRAGRLSKARLPPRFPLIWIGFLFLLCASTVYVMHTNYITL
jgi:hypothetical protein